MKRENQINRSIETAKKAGATDKQMRDLKSLLPVGENKEVREYLNVERINKHLRANVTFEGNHYLLRAFVGECMMFALNEDLKGLLNIAFDDGIFHPITYAEMLEFPNFAKAWGVQKMSTSK